MSALNKVPQLPDVLIIDGYVWLSNEDGAKKKPGLGAHLFNSLDQRIPIIGVAKSMFSADCGAIAVVRGSARTRFMSQQPEPALIPQQSVLPICMNMIRKGQVVGVTKGDIVSQMEFVNEIFGVAA